MKPARVNLVFDWIALCAIIAATFLYNRWMLDPRTYFVSDDWQWLRWAEFVPWANDYFSFLPAAPYNDRPGGFALFKAFYQIVGIDHAAFQLLLLCLHALNCVLLYAIGVRYVERSGALLAALLAAVWYSANGAVSWPAAIFDVFGATLCISVILLRQLAIGSGHVRYDVAGVACYILAIRTKEFALGMVALLVVMNVIAERQTIRATIRQLVPYFVVFGIYSIRYAQLLSASAPAASDPYHLDFSLQAILASLGFYVRTLFYAEDVTDTIVTVALIVAMGLGLFAAKERAQRTALFGMAGFVILLGPTLLIPQHQASMYLYAPHFFIALVIGALLSRNAMPATVAVIATIAILVAPATIHTRKYAVNFYMAKGEVSQAQFASAMQLLPPLAKGTTIFISGVEPHFSPFSVLPGDSLKTAFKDATLTAVLDKPEADLVKGFCNAAEPRRFLRFTGKTGTDATVEIEKRCNRREGA